jgi:hypothetical protein
MPSPRTNKKRRAEPATKQQEPAVKKQATEQATEPETETAVATNGSNGTMADEKAPRFETLQLHAGYVFSFSFPRPQLELYMR